MPNHIEIPPEVTRVKQRFSIVGNSRALVEAIERAIKVAPIDLSVLVIGESGAGKEFFPKIIHNFGARKHAKYIAVNCGAIPEGTIDSELFGHEKGSFTGALSTRKGYFEEADGGTIFLDEVAELPLTTQARLLRVLESGEFLKVGSSQVQKANVRVVAATNVNLLKAVAEGKFREDLYYRLSTVQINVPALHDRGQDIILLARKFASDFSEKYMMPAITFAEDARRMMLLYRWSEFIPHSSETSVTTRRAAPSYESEREMLWHTILSLRGELQALRDEIGAEAPIEPERNLPAGTAGIPKASSVVPYSEPEFTPYEPASLEENERQTIIQALNRCGGVRKRAAKELNISERTLYRKIKEYGLD